MPEPYDGAGLPSRPEASPSTLPGPGGAGGSGSPGPPALRPLVAPGPAGSALVAFGRHRTGRGPALVYEAKVRGRKPCMPLRESKIAPAFFIGLGGCGGAIV